MSYDVIVRHYRTHEIISKEDGDELRAETLKHWRECCQNILQREPGCNAYLKLFKYKLNAFFSYYIESPLPVSPFSPEFRDDPAVLIGGYARKRLRQLIHSKFQSRYIRLDSMRKLGPAQENLASFLTGVLYIKKALPRPRDEDVKKEVQKTIDGLFGLAPTPCNHLSSICPCQKCCRYFRDPENGWDELFPDDKFDWQNGHVSMCQDSLEFQLKRTVFELFKGKTFGPDEAFTPIFPSTKANVEYRRKDGGGVAALFAECKDDLKRMRKKNKPFCTVKREPKLNSDGTFEFVEAKAIGVDRERFNEGWTTVSQHIFSSAIGESTEVEPVGLPEPLKVRIITKEPPLLTMCLKPLQKWMWDRLAQFPQFRLLKEPEVTEEMLSEMFDNVGQGMKFLSGDYSAATNNIRSLVSNVIVDHIVDLCFFPDDAALRESFRILFRRALTGHTYQGRLQQNGQLMGSIVSFPILCIANFALCRYVMELDRLMMRDEGKLPGVSAEQCKLPLRRHNRVLNRELAMLINGDDCLFPLSPRGYKIWANVGEVFGLPPSPGKVYHHVAYVNINSTSFYYTGGVNARDPSVYEAPDVYFSGGDCGVDSLDFSYGRSSFERRELLFRHIGYINWGLVTGMKRSGGAKNKESSLNSSSGPRRKTSKLGEGYSAPALLLGQDRCNEHTRDKTLSERSWEIYHKTPRQYIAKVASYFITPLLNADWGSTPLFLPEKYGGLGICPHLKEDGISRYDRALCLYVKRHRIRFKPLSEVGEWKVRSLSLSGSVFGMGKEFEETLVSREKNYAIGVGLSPRTSSRAKDSSGFLCNLSLVFALLPQIFSSVHLDVLQNFAHNRRIWQRVRKLAKDFRGRSCTFDPWADDTETELVPNIVESRSHFRPYLADIDILPVLFGQ